MEIVDDLTSPRRLAKFLSGMVSLPGGLSFRLNSSWLLPTYECHSVHFCSCLGLLVTAVFHRCYSQAGLFIAPLPWQLPSDSGSMEARPQGGGFQVISSSDNLGSVFLVCSVFNPYGLPSHPEKQLRTGSHVDYSD